MAVFRSIMAVFRSIMAVFRSIMARFEVFTHLRETPRLSNSIKHSDSTCTQVSQRNLKS